MISLKIFLYLMLTMFGIGFFRDVTGINRFTRWWVIAWRAFVLGWLAQLLWWP